MIALKFCGLTRAEDAAEAATLGAAYVGVIFAGGPRLLTAARARDVLDAARGPRRVGVFGAQSPSEIGAIAETAGLDVVQLHADPTVADVAAVRAEFGGAVWAVVRTNGVLPTSVGELAGVSDALLLDAHAPGALGGTGLTLPWAALRVAVAELPVTLPIVLAGGLRPDNVGSAARAFAPAVVDVSSGVEQGPGIKDHRLMRAFTDALALAQEP